MVTDVEEGQNQYPAFQVTRKVFGLAARKQLLTWELKKIYLDTSDKQKPRPPFLTVALHISV